MVVIGFWVKYMKSKDKTLILVTGTSSGIGKELRLILYKDLKYDLKVFHSRTPSVEYIENENNKFLFGNIEDFSIDWFDDYDLSSFSTIVFVNNDSL